MKCGQKNITKKVAKTEQGVSKFFDQLFNEKNSITSFAFKESLGKAGTDMH